MYSVFRAIEEPLRIHRVGDRKQRQQAVRELVDQVALPSSVSGPAAARALGRSAAAGRDRPGVGAAARRPGVRRGGLGARRAGAGADPGPAGRTAGQPGSDLPVHQPRSGGDPADLRRRPGDAGRPGGGTREPPKRYSPGPVTSTPGNCLEAIPGAAPVQLPDRLATCEADPLAPLMELPGVAEASDRAREALGRAHRHRANLRGWPVTAAEASLRAARASSVLDGGPVRLDDLADAGRCQRSGVRGSAAGGAGAGRRRGPAGRGVAEGAAAGAGPTARAGGRRSGGRRAAGPPARSTPRSGRGWSCSPTWSPVPPRRRRRWLPRSRTGSC